MPESGAQGDKQAQQQYQEKYNQVKPKPPILKNIVWAFIVGGLICTLGQFIQNYFVSVGFTKKEAAGPTAVVLVFLSAFFTALGVYDELGRRAGAGSIVPITGFANSVVAPAMEFKREGFVFGVGAKMFIIAGPVLVYGMLTSFIIGFIYWLAK
ncbi:stage V sporulation protein AC [Sporolituus thermophilus]|uniref:Stage V sporulation protein AC n=1 Tax=Sporolituus thermophilus DSM 23256 TaxID=1123285 RepID=A0A1G7JLQ6_9FIRM|nr:stage V sporulation protein AC [Sporolituus thermophilus]SDF25399.1 stage V sporulation protein AC [Sporolituus thermophilus DSM 23256]